MASGVVASLLSSVTKLLDLLLGGAPAVSRREGRQTVSVEVQRLQRLLRRIQARLDDAGEREIRDSSAKLWIAEITAVARDAEDILDDYRYELIKRRVEEIHGSAASTSCKRKHHDDEDYGIYERIIRKITRRFSISTDRAGFQLRPEGDDGGTSEGTVDITRWFEEITTDRAALQLRPEDEDDDINKRIGEIVCRFEEITGDRAALHLRQEDGERITWSGRDSMWESRATSHLLDESCVFGRTKEKEQIVKLVISYSKCPGIHVLPIVGMGGIGKTMVAQMVYREIQESYELMSWVHVPETFDLRKLAIALTESLTRQPCTYNNFSSIHDVLQQEVQKRSVFLVLDDLWNERQSCWQDFLRPLKVADTVTILVTTRSKEVAQLVQTVPHFELGSLPEDHCWQLFQCYAFGHKNIHEASTLVQVGRKIMQKCGGLPLAIKSIGCLLRSKMDMQTWMEISNSEFREYSDNNDEILSALRLSFHRLPGRLKPCFLLCALYPKGEPFTKDDMIHLWIAHGYVQHSGCKTLEKVAGEYFDELNERSLIETDTFYLVSREGYSYLQKSHVRSPVAICSGEIFDAGNSFYELHIRSLVETSHKEQLSLLCHFNCLGCMT